MNDYSQLLGRIRDIGSHSKEPSVVETLGKAVDVIVNLIEQLSAACVDLDERGGCDVCKYSELQEDSSEYPQLCGSCWHGTSRADDSKWEWRGVCGYNCEHKD